MILFVTDLSPDAVAQICNFLEFDDVLALWLGGSVALQHLLGARGGWRVLHILQDHFFGCIHRWPRLLVQELKGLRSFRLSPSNPDRLLPLLKPSHDDIASLSRFLTDIELGFVEALSDESVPHFPSSLTRLSLPFNRRISAKGLAKLPESLSALNLQRSMLITQASELPRQLSVFVGNSAAFKPESSWTGLPPLLEHLELVNPKHALSTWTVFDISKLEAPYLRHLLLPVRIVRDSVAIERDHVWKFPPCLETLALYHTGCSNFTHRAVSSLPPTLTSLRLSTPRFLILDWTNDTIALLPRSLLRLNIKAYPENSSPPMAFGFRAQGSKLSDSMASLEGEFQSASGITPLCFKDLPRSLTDFKITLLKVSLMDVSSQMERIATEYSFKLPRDFSATLEENMLLLPPNLTRFDTILSPDCKKQHATRLAVSSHCLPPKLRQYSGYIAANEFSTRPITEPSVNAPFAFEEVAYRPIQAPIGSDTCVLFPPRIDAESIAKLQGLWSESLVRLRFSPSSPGNLKLLPRSRLTFLYLENATIDDRSILDLPETLTHLVLESPQGIITDEMLPALPLDLTTLEISGARELRGDIYPFPRKLTSLVLMSHYKKRNAKSGGLFIPKLPPYLTSLHLFSPLASDETFAQLPPNLTELKTGALNGHFFAALPRTLLNLEFRSGIAFDDAIDDLPRGLKVFLARYCGEDLTDYSCASWPPLLHTLSMAASNISDEGIRQLPRSITAIDMRNPQYTSCATAAEVSELLGPRWQKALIGRRMTTYVYRQH